MLQRSEEKGLAPLSPAFIHVHAAVTGPSLLARSTSVSPYMSLLGFCRCSGLAPTARAGKLVFEDQPTSRGVNVGVVVYTRVSFSPEAPRRRRARTPRLAVTGPNGPRTTRPVRRGECLAPPRASRRA